VHCSFAIRESQMKDNDHHCPGYSTGTKLLYPCFHLLNQTSACYSFGGCFRGTCLLQAENLRPGPCRENSCAGDNPLFLFQFSLHVPQQRLYPIILSDTTFTASRCLVSNRAGEILPGFLGDGRRYVEIYINLKTTNYVDIIFKNSTGEPTQPTSRS